METGWLVESKHPTTKRPQWLGLVESFGGEMRYSWRDDSSEAIRFCRIEDAMRFGKLYRDRGGLHDEKFDVTEHVWVDGVPANAEVTGA